MIEVQVFASLTDYYEETFFLELGVKKNIADVLQELEVLNPKAKQLLSVCRAALNEEFCSLEQKVKEGDSIFVFPPFSGG